ncbi:hypothetical protein EJ07DRAFT_160450 [Lizonia empirigonia]|nr:hypothetical protein EJ07DRAFT_160450 [Lizonia empirigonia]
MSASNAISREEILRLCSKDGSPEFRSSVYILTRILNDQEAKGVPALEKHRKATSTSALCERAKIFNASLTAEFLDLKWKCWQSRKNDFLKARRAKSTEVTRAQEHLVRDVDAMQIVYGKAVALFIADFPDAQNCWKNSTTRAAVMVFVVNPRNRVGEQTPRTSAKRPANDSPGPPKRHCPTIADVYSSDGSTENHHADPTQAEASGATNTPPNKTFNQVETVTIDSYSTPDAAFQPETCGVWTGNQSCPTISPSANEDPDLTDIPHDPCDIPHNLSGTPHHLTDIVHEGFNSTLRQRIAQLFTAQIYQFSLENRAVPAWMLKVWIWVNCLRVYSGQTVGELRKEDNWIGQSVVAMWCTTRCIVATVFLDV